MCRKLFFLICFGLVLSVAEPASAICFDTISSYEPYEVSDLNVSPNPAFSPTLDINWPVLGGVNDVPEATEGKYVLKLCWTNETDRKIEVRHDWNSSTFDLAGVAYISVDVYFATESALPAPEKKNISIWTVWDSNKHWISCERIPPTIGEWYTVSFYVGNLEYTDVNHITALTFEDMNGTEGIIYIDNLQLVTESPHYPYQCPYFGRKIKFSGYWWSILQSKWPMGAGPNYYTDDSNDVWVDPNGHLHLSIVKKDSNWYCSEVIANENFGYGTYAFTVKSDINQLDPNIILGLFIYDVPDQQGNPREIDVELTKWGDPNNPNNAQFVVQPWQHEGNVYRFNIDYSGDTETTTYAITWKPNRIDFCSYYGDYSPHPRGEDIIDCWSYLGDDIPKPGCENPRINFYLMNGDPPTNGQDAEIVIKNFQYLSAVSVEAAIDIDPNTLNLQSKGKWITCYIWLPEGYDVDDVDTTTIVLKKDDFEVGGEYGEFQTGKLMVKFPRSQVQDILEPGEVELTVTGELTDGTKFEGSDTIRVIDKGGKK